MKKPIGINRLWMHGGKIMATQTWRHWVVMLCYSGLRLRSVLRCFTFIRRYCAQQTDSNQQIFPVIWLQSSLFL